MNLLNFKELSGKDLNALVDLGIDTKTNPKKYAKALTGSDWRFPGPFSQRKA